MSRLQIPETVLRDLAHYEKFKRELQEAGTANDEATCLAMLIKEHGLYRYELTWMPTSHFVAEYIYPFEPTQENFEKFQQGCRDMAEALRVLVDTRDPEKLAGLRPFGDLTAPTPEGVVD